MKRMKICMAFIVVGVMLIFLVAGYEIISHLSEFTWEEATVMIGGILLITGIVAIHSD